MYCRYWLGEQRKEQIKLFHARWVKSEKEEPEILKFDVEAAVGYAQRVAAAGLVEREGEAAGSNAPHAVKLGQFHLPSSGVIARIEAFFIRICNELIDSWTKNRRRVSSGNHHELLHIK